MRLQKFLSAWIVGGGIWITGLIALVVASVAVA